MLDCKSMARKVISATGSDVLDSSNATASSRSVLLAMSWYDARVHEGVARFAARAGWHLDARMANSSEPAWGWSGDGVLCKLGCSEVDEKLRDFVCGLGLPTVDLSVFGPNHGLPSLEFDPREIGRLAADHFFERGFRHFAWYPVADGKPVRLRREGFELALRERGHEAIAIEPIPTAEGEPWEARERALGERLAALPRPIGVLAFNDDWAVQVLRGCARAGLIVPDEVAVLGIDNQELVCNHLPIPLSSVRLDLESWGERAAGKLDARMRGTDDELETEWVSPSEVVPRASTDVLAVEHPGVARAVEYIGAHYTERIGVDEVVAASGLSRSGLKQAFRKYLHRSVHDELVRVRSQAARRLLVDTDWTLERIAEDVGLGSTRNLFRLFAREESMTPHAYRQARRAAQ